MSFSPLIIRLMESLRCLPGVGPKSAQRMTMHLLERDRAGARQLAETLLAAMEGVGRCKRCRMLNETELCSICTSESRDKQLLCVVETPTDVLVIEQAGSYRGYYFVLMGHLSPIDGVGPNDIGVPDLIRLLDQADIKEVILATNLTVEGEATAHYLAEEVRHRGMKVSRIAHGVPLGGELEYVDGGTLMHAFAGRREVMV